MPLTRRALIPAWAILAAALVAPAPCPAQDPEARLAELEAQYAKDPAPELRYEIGKILFELERYDEARAQLQAYLDDAGEISAKRKNEVQAILYKILKSEHLLYTKAKKLAIEQHHVQAKKALLAYLEDVGETISELRGQEAQALLEELESHIGRVTFTCNAEGAKAYISGKFVGTIPLKKPAEVSEGEHLVEVFAHGYETATKMVTIKGGKLKSLKILLGVRKPPPSCADIDCTEHGTCTMASGLPECVCENYFVRSSSGTECLPPTYLPKRIKTAAIASIAMTTIASIGMIIGPMILMMNMWEMFEPALAITISSGALMAISVPVGIETYARYTKIFYDRKQRRIAVVARAFALVGFTVAVPMLFHGMFWWGGDPNPVTIIALMHFAGLAATGIAMSAKAIGGARNEEQKGQALSIQPWVSGMPGGAAAGLSGRF